MTDPGPATSRRFNEKEVALIIKRASELQQTETTSESSTGMSLAELEQVAREAGLDLQLVRRAAADLDTRVTDRAPNGFLGAPTVLRLERTIDGEVPADEFEQLVLEIQSQLGQVGSATTIGRTLQWTVQGADRRRAATRTVQVTISPRDGRTTIRIEERLRGLAGGLFGGLMGGLGGGMSGVAAGIGFGALHSGAAFVGIWGSVIGASYLLARTIYGRVVRGRGDELQSLMSRIADHVSHTAVRAPGLARPVEEPRSLEGGGKPFDR